MNEEDKLKRFLQLTDRVALNSKDPSTKVGAIFLNKDETSPRSFGYNGMPRGLDDSNEIRNERPEKYLWYEHAERNAIYNIARESLEGHIIFSTRFPNMEGARAIVSSGLSKMVIKSFNKDSLSIEEKENYRRVVELFSETNVKIIEINSNEIKGGFYWDNQKIDSNSYIEQEKEYFKLKEKYLNFLEILENYAENFSPYEKEKSASMILNYKTLAPLENAFGVYAPPSKINEITEEMINNQEDWFLESEKNAIFNSVRDKFEGSTAVVCWCPCVRCSLSLVAVGFKKVVTRKPEFNKEADLRWKESFDKSMKLFNSTEISLVLLPVPRPEFNNEGNVTIKKSNNNLNKKNF